MFYNIVVSHQALAGHGDMKEDRTEKQIVALLTLPLNSYDPVTVLGLSTYPRVMSLLKPVTCKVCSQCIMSASGVAVTAVTQYVEQNCLGCTLSCDYVLQAMAVKIVQTILKVGTKISEPAQVEMLLDFIAPLVADSPTIGDEDDDEVLHALTPCLFLRCVTE